MSENNPNPTPTEPVTPANGTGEAPAGDAPATEPTTPAPAAEPNPQGGEAAPAEGDVDYKVKFGESTKEANRLLEVLKANGIDPKTGKKPEDGAEGADPAPTQPTEPERADLPELSEEELESAFPSYPMLSPQEKEVIKNIQQLPKALRMVAEMHDKYTTDTQLANLKTQEGYELLGEHEEEFRTFIYKEENLKKDLNLLADSFILQKTREKAKAGTDAPNPEENTPEGMEGGTHGAGTIGKQTGDKLEVTQEEAERLRKGDPRRYNKLVSQKKLQIVD